MISLILFSSCGQVGATSITIDNFGLHSHSFYRGGAWPSVPFGFIRLWDSDTKWRDIEPERNKWKFETLDTYVNAAQSNNVKVLLTLGQTPAWAADNPNAESPYGAGASSPPRSLNDWRRYVDTLGRRYKGRILHWEVWNEANVPHFWAGDFATLAELERVAVETLKNIDPENVILTPSIQGGAFGKLNQYFSAGGGQSADVVSYHFYSPTEDPEIVYDRISTVREIMVAHSLGNKPLWNTETGYLIANRDGGYGSVYRPAWDSWNKLNYEEAPGVIMRAYLINIMSGIDRMFWYAWDNQAMGLAEDKGYNPKLAAEGYARTIEWLVGADLRGCAGRIGGVWSCRLTREGRREYIVWSQSGREFSVPLAWKVRNVVTIDGAVSTLPNDGILEIGTQPKLLR